MYENENSELLDPVETDLDLNRFIMTNDVYNFLPNEYFSEDTLEANSTFKFVPFSPRGPPKRENFQGEANFQIELDVSRTEKKKYIFSQKLERIYVKMGCNFSVKFNWDVTKFQGDMYVRATVVFSDSAQAEKKVERCYQHSHEKNNVDMNDIVVRNVLRSGREYGSADVFYCGAPDPDSWYSVLVRARAPLGHAYYFVCKNSCSSGINRRAIELIFTLEDCAGKVYGRKTLGARVCSCTKRDLNRDETGGSSTKKRRASAPAPAPAAEHTKKIKIEVADQENQKNIITLPSIQVVGVRTAMTGLRVMLDMQEQALAINTANQQPVDDLNKSIPELKKILEDLENNKTV